MRPWLILLNNFCHDLFTGLWFGSFVTLYVLREKTAGISSAEVWLVELNSFFFNLCMTSLFLICLTGYFRFLYSRGGGADLVEQATGKLKKQMLIVKHAVLGTSFLGGSLFAYLWTH